MSNLEQQIKEMAKLTVLSNRISSIHEKNLKHFPLVAFDGIKSVKIDYDLSHKKTADDEPSIANSLVSYYLDIDETVENTHLDRRFKGLESWVRHLFWSDVVVEVYFNDRIVYKSKKTQSESL